MHDTRAELDELDCCNYTKHRTSKVYEDVNVLVNEVEDRYQELADADEQRLDVFLDVVHQLAGGNADRQL